MVLCIFFRLYIGTVIIDAFVLLHLVDIYLFTKKKTKWWEKRLAFSTIVVFIRWKGLQNLELVYAISIVDFKTMFIDIKKANFFFISFSFRWQYFMAFSNRMGYMLQLKNWKRFPNQIMENTLLSIFYIHSQPLGFINGYTIYIHIFYFFNHPWLWYQNNWR